jgi:hypothetical protein
MVGYGAEKEPPGKPGLETGSVEYPLSWAEAAWVVRVRMANTLSNDSNRFMESTP